MHEYTIELIAVGCGDLFILFRITTNQRTKMKVYQLMTILEKAPAGAEVVVNMSTTLNATVESVETSDGELVITGGDAEVIDTNGDSMGWLSEISNVEEESE
jgi:hypothetical protein